MTMMGLQTTITTGWPPFKLDYKLIKTVTDDRGWLYKLVDDKQVHNVTTKWTYFCFWLQIWPWWTTNKLQLQIDHHHHPANWLVDFLQMAKVDWLTTNKCTMWPRQTLTNVFFLEWVICPKNKLLTTNWLWWTTNNYTTWNGLQMTKKRLDYQQMQNVTTKNVHQTDYDWTTNILQSVVVPPNPTTW
jgi:hypothetical protein